MHFSDKETVSLTHHWVSPSVALNVIHISVWVFVKKRAELVWIFILLLHLVACVGKSNFLMELTTRKGISVHPHQRIRKVMQLHQHRSLTHLLFLSSLLIKNKMLVELQWLGKLIPWLQHMIYSHQLKELSFFNTTLLVCFTYYVILFQNFTSPIFKRKTLTFSFPFSSKYIVCIVRDLFPSGKTPMHRSPWLQQLAQTIPFDFSLGTKSTPLAVW